MAFLFCLAFCWGCWEGIKAAARASGDLPDRQPHYHFAYAPACRSDY